VKSCPVCGKEYPDASKFCPVDGSTLRSRSPTADLVGQVVADRYAIIRKLGEGGMGAVYLGEHVKMGRRSAIKVMNPAMAGDPDAISRFNREASNASRISHPNVCQIYDFGETADGIIYLAMEYIEGASLTAIIEREGALPPVRAVRILKQAAEALASAHDLGIVHRDLKPDNIMIVQARDGSDIVKVVDFGIAKAVAGDDAGQKVTKTGLVVGTPEYMSPEQLSGDKLDGRSDIYSLGLVFYRMLTGVLPFQADSAQEAMIKRLTDEPLPLLDARPDLTFPPMLQEVLDKALARAPADRYGGAAQFGLDAEAAIAGLVAPATRADMATAQAATQLLDARSRGPAGRRPGPPAAVGSARVKRAFPVVPVLGGVGAVGAIAVVAALSLRGHGPTSSLASDTAQQAAGGPAPGGPGAQGSGRGTQTAAPGSTETATKHAAGPENRQPERGAQPNPERVTAPPSPPAVNLDDSLTAARSALDGQRDAVAYSAAYFVYNHPRASAHQRSQAAQYIAETRADANDSDGYTEWLRRAVQADPTNQAAAEALRRLGVSP
jgi:hypothetical protein